MNTELLDICLTQYDLPATEKYILFTLCAHAHPVSLETCVPQKKIALLTGLNRKTVVKGIKSLVDKKRLIYENKLSGKTYSAKVYRINITKQDLPKEKPKPKRKQISQTWRLKATIELCKRYGYECQFCGCKEDLQVDHIVPLSKGGSNDIENLQLLCKPCNVKKSDN